MHVPHAPPVTHSPSAHPRHRRPLLEAQDLLELPSLLDAMQCCLLLLEPAPGTAAAAAAASVSPSSPVPAESSSYDISYANRAAAHMLSGKGARQGGSEPRSDQAEIPAATPASSNTAPIKAEDRPLMTCHLRQMGLRTRLSHYIPDGSMGVSAGGLKGRAAASSVKEKATGVQMKGFRAQVSPPPAGISPLSPLPLPLFHPAAQDHLAVRHEKDSRSALCELRVLQQLPAGPSEGAAAGQQQRHPGRECSTTGLVCDLWSPAGGWMPGGVHRGAGGWGGRGEEQGEEWGEAGAVDSRTPLCLSTPSPSMATRLGRCFALCAGRPMGKALLFDSWRVSGSSSGDPSSSSCFLGRPLLPDLTEEESSRLEEAAQRDDEAVRSHADRVRQLKVQGGLGNKVSRPACELL